MLEQYEFEGEIFNVHPSQKEDFLKKYPNAQPKQSEPDFQTPTTPDAVVEETAASDTGSNSDPGSLDLQIDPNKFKVFDPKSIDKPTGLGDKDDLNIDSEKTKKNINQGIKAKEKEVKKKKNEELTIANRAIDDILNDDELLEKYAGTTDAEALNREGANALPKKLRMLIGDKLGYGRVSVPFISGAGAMTDMPQYTKETNDFKILQEDEVNDLIQERFTERVNEKKRDFLNAKNKNANVYYNQNNLSRKELHDTFFENDIADLPYLKKQIALLNRKFNATETLFTEKDKIKAELERLNNMQSREVAHILRDGSVIYKSKNNSWFINTETGNTVNSSMLESEQNKGAPILDISDRVQAHMKYAPTDLSKLKQGLENLNMTQVGLDMEGSELHKVQIDNESLALFVKQEGYEPKQNKDGQLIYEVPLSVLGKKGFNIINKDGLMASVLKGHKGGKTYEYVKPVDSEMTPREFGDYILNYQEAVFDTKAKRSAYVELYYLNKDPKSIKRQSIFETGNRGLTSGLGYDPKQTGGNLGQNIKMQEIANITNELGIELTKEQADYLKPTFGEELGETAVSFAPIGASFFGLNKVQGIATAVLKVNNLMQMGAKAGQIVNGVKLTAAAAKRRNIVGAGLGMLFEEAKTSSLGFDFGSGLAFSGIGTLTKGFKLKTKYNQLDLLINKVGKGGLTFALAAEGAGVLEAAVRDFSGTDEFNSWMNEHYKDMPTVSRRLLSNVLMGNMLTLTHTSSKDFKKTNQLVRMQSESLVKYFYAKKLGNEKAAEKYKFLHNEVDAYLQRHKLGEYYSTPENAQEYYNNKMANVKKEFKEKLGIDLNYKIEKNNDNKDFNENTDKANFEVKNSKEYEIKINLENAEMGVIGHETGHAGIAAKIGKNAAIKEKHLESFKSILNDIKLDSGISLLDAIKSEKSISDVKTHEEMFTYTAEYLAKNKYYTQFVAQNAFSNVKQNLIQFFETNFKNNYKPKLKTKKDIIEFLGRYAISINKGKGFTTYIERFNELLESGEPGAKSKNKENFDSKKLDLESDKKTGVEKLEAKIIENKDMGPGNVFLRKNIELDFKDQIKKVKDLEIQFSASELRAQLKKAKGKEKENLELALQEKFKGFESEVGITGLDIKTGKEKFDSKDLNLETKKLVEINNKIEKDILARGEKGYNNKGDFIGFKPSESQSMELLTNNLGTIGVMAGKLADPKRQEANNIPKEKRLSYDALYNELYVLGEKISTQFRVKEGKTAPFGAYLKQRINERYSLAFKELKRGEQEGIRLDDTKLAETLTGGEGSKEIQKDLIEPLEKFVPEKANREKYQKEYEKNITDNKLVTDFSNYATLKDASPQTTNKIVGKTPTQIKESVKNNGKTQFEIMPEPSRRVTKEQIQREGNKSSTEVKDSVLDIISVKAEPGEVTATGRASTVTGTAAGLEIRAKMPDYSKTKHTRGDYKGYTVEGAILERSGVGIIKDGKLIELDTRGWKKHYNENGIPAWYKPKKGTNPTKEKQISGIIRNQSTFQQAWKAEIGRAITNNIARKNPNHPQKLIEQLAAGKSETLASTILDIAGKRKKEFISDKIFASFGGAIKEEDLTGIMQGFYNGIRNIPDFSLLILSSNLAPSGSGLKRIFAGKQTFFASNKKGFEKEVQDAINDGRILDLHALIELKNQLGGGEVPKWAKAIQSQTTQKYKKSIEKGINSYNQQKKTHQDGVVKVLDILSEFYKINPKAAGLLAYNSNANSSSTKNMAQMRGMEVVIDGKKFEIREEHVLQHGQFARLAGEYAKLKNDKNADPTRIKEMADYIAKNYFQLSLASKNSNQKGIKFADRIDTHAKVDRKYEFEIEGTKYKVDLKSELHPVHEMQVKEAIAGKRKWSEVISPLIRMYNSQVGKGKGGSINMNKVMQDGISHAQKFDLVVPKSLENNRSVYEKQAELAEKQMLDPSFKGKKELDAFINKIAPANVKAALKISKGKTKDIKEAIEKIQQIDKVNVEKQKEVFASKDLNAEFNKFLETSTGIGAEKVFSESKATVRGKKVKKSFGDYFIPVGAEDFAGLMHKTLAKGKKGDKQLEFYNENLYKPFNVANENMTRESAALMNDFRALKQNLTSVPKDLNKMTKGGDFTIEQALRVAVWNKQGMEIPGLSKTDKAELLKEVNSNPELSNFANELLKTTKGDGYAKPENNWELGTIVTDLMSLLNGPKRAKHLEVWSNNVEQIFSKENRYKLEAAYGRDYVQTLGKTLERMKNGSNRKWGGNPTVEKWLDWVNGSVGAIMFLNTRSAALQTISSINYLNFSDNNPLAAAKAFANQPQFWKDFKEIYNSDYLKDRRGGNKINVNESELALAAEKGGIQGVISLMLNKGFVLTKGADSFAIASGGSAMYRNRINKYQKEGLSEKEAKEKAFLDFKAITEETQQSSRADRISEQQASNAGRLLLAFANTPMQYNRLIKRNAQDLLAGRGNKAEKITRIAYYSTVQNFIFNALQKALFAVGFGDDDEETVKKYSNIGNGMVDSLLRGSGLTGNAALAIKNVAMDVADRFDRPRPNFQDAAWKALTVSPPIYSKVSKLRSAGYSLGYTTKDNIFNPSLDNPALSAGAQITSATLNLPLDRVLRKAQNIEAAMSDEAEWWQRSALLMGWGTWELGMQEPRGKAKKKKSNKGLKTKSLKL